MLGLGTTILKTGKLGVHDLGIVTSNLVLKHNYDLSSVQPLSDGAVYFLDGTDPYIQLPSAFNVADRSVTCWIYAIDRSDSMMIFDNRDGSTDGFTFFVDGDFPTGTTAWTKSANWTISDGVASCSGSAAQLLYQSGIMPVGTNYKLTITVLSFTSGYLSAYGGDWDTAVIAATGTFIRYSKSLGTITGFVGNSFIGSIANVSIKAINDKNHATTVFTGDELVTNGDMSGTTTMNSVGFTYYNSSGAAESGTIGGVANTWKITAGGSDSSAQIRIIPNDSSAIGRTYSISIKVYNPSSGGVTNIQPRYIKQDTNPVSYGSAITATDTWTTVTGTMIYDGTVSQPLNISASSANAEVFYIDDWSVKEVGVASGWTDADQQLHIPQTALQSYNELAWFDGVGDYVSIADHNDFTFGDGSNDSVFSVSAWIYPSTLAYFSIVDKYSSNDKEYLLELDNNGKLFSSYIRTCAFIHTSKK